MPALGSKTTSSRPRAAGCCASPHWETPSNVPRRRPTMPCPAPTSTVSSIVGTSAGAPCPSPTPPPATSRPANEPAARTGPTLAHLAPEQDRECAGGNRGCALQQRRLDPPRRGRRPESLSGKWPRAGTRGGAVQPRAGSPAAALGERAAPSSGGPSLGGHGRLARDTPPQPLCPHRSHERALLRGRSHRGG